MEKIRPASMIPRSSLPVSRFEHAPLAIFAGSLEASRAVAAEAAELIRRRQTEGRPAVLGLATGSTPVTFYAEIVRMHREEGLSLRNVISFNLDEYYGLTPDHPRVTGTSCGPICSTWSISRWIRPMFPRAGCRKRRSTCTAPPTRSGSAPPEASTFKSSASATPATSVLTSRAVPRRSVTRLVTLDPLTRRDAAGDFGGDEATPHFAITMGVKTILAARRVVLMAWGQHKAEVIRSAIEGEASARVPASFLQEHENALFVLDGAAASALTRIRTPWLVGPLSEQGLEWSEPMIRRAILWLSQRGAKAILKLTDDDYNEAGLQDLLRVFGSAYEANLAGFYQLQHTITGWPGGRDPARARAGDAPVRPLRNRSAGVYPKRILVLSPHPDDDVISMGGTLCRLVEHGHAVHIAYEVSGAGAVSDEAVWRALAFARDAGLAPPEGPAAELCGAFERSGALPASAETSAWKSLIRRSEAIAAARVCGVPASHLHFLDLPFYGSAAPRSRRVGPRDVAILRGLLSQFQPHLIYAAGDLDDPHGTHRLCLRVLREALAAEAESEWIQHLELWLYRGAWAGGPSMKSTWPCRSARRRFSGGAGRFFGMNLKRIRLSSSGTINGSSGNGPKTGAGIWPRPTTPSAWRNMRRWRRSRRFSRPN